MLKHLVVTAVLLAGCGPEDMCSGSASVCSTTRQWPGDKPGTGTHLFQCVNGHTQLVYCKNGCVVGTAGADVCNP